MFLILDACPSYDMCSFDGHEMNCASKNLLVLPCASSAPPNVIELRLDRNQLSTIGHGLLAGLKSVQSLYHTPVCSLTLRHLQSNKITSIQNGAFSDLEELTTL
jgi:hypothetical protein